MQPRDLVGQPGRVAVPPLDQEPLLAARGGGVGSEVVCGAEDMSRVEAQARRAEEPDVVAGVEQRAADRQEAERDLVAGPQVRRQRLVRRVDEKYPHDGPPRKRRTPLYIGGEP